MNKEPTEEHKRLNELYLSNNENSCNKNSGKSNIYEGCSMSNCGGVLNWRKLIDNDSYIEHSDLKLTLKKIKKKLHIKDIDQRNILRESSEFIKKNLTCHIEIILENNYLNKNLNEPIYKIFLIYLNEIVSKNKFDKYLYSNHQKCEIKCYLNSNPLNYMIRIIKLYSDILKENLKMYIFTEFQDISNIKNKVYYILDTYRNYQIDLDNLFASSMTIKEYYEELINKEILSSNQILVYEKLLYVSEYRKKKYDQVKQEQISHNINNSLTFTKKKRNSN